MYWRLCACNFAGAWQRIAVLLCARATHPNDPTDRWCDYSRHVAATFEHASKFRDAPGTYQHAQIVPHGAFGNSNLDILSHRHPPSHPDHDRARVAIHSEAASGITRGVGA